MANPTGIRRRYLSARDTAVYLGLAKEDDKASIERGVDALYQWVNRGGITHCKLGKKLRFDIVDLDAMMQKSKVIAAA